MKILQSNVTILYIYRIGKYNMKYKKIMVVLFAFLLIIIQLFIIGIARVDGNSMNPNLKNNQLLLYSKNINKINRFDIVIIKVNGNLYVKRVIGLPSESIEYRDNNLYVNENKIQENYKRTTTDDFNLLDISSNTKVPNNKFLVLGDNRSYSYDSRNFGLIDKSQIIGKLILKL